MRKLEIVSLAGAVLMTVALAVPATAERLYHWVGEDGTAAFTDDYDRIPEARRPGAKVIDTQGLDGYARYTPQDTSRREADDASRLARIERLRGLNTPQVARGLPAVSSPPPTGGVSSGYTATVDVNGSTIRIPAEMGNGDGPIVVEQIRSVRKGKNVTQTATVVRQGDEILMIVYPNPHAQINSKDFVREEDLTN